MKFKITTGNMLKGYTTTEHESIADCPWLGSAISSLENFEEMNSSIIYNTIDVFTKRKSVTIHHKKGKFEVWRNFKCLIKTESTQEIILLLCKIFDTRK